MRLAGGKFGETLSFCRNVGSLPQVRQWNFGISARLTLNLSGNLNKSAASGAGRRGMEGALWHRIMLTIAEDLSTRTLPQTAVPACTREEAAQLLDSLREQYQSLRPLARAQVKLLMAGLTIAQCSRELQ